MRVKNEIFFPFYQSGIRVSQEYWMANIKEEKNEGTS
jgi:hypothetical protein